MSFNMNMIAHLRAVTECLPRFKARAELKLGTFKLELRANGRYFEFIPQYAKFKNGRIEYTPLLSPDVEFFIGWRDYFNKRWDLSNDKLVFKEYCARNGVRVPKLFARADDVTTDVIIKRKQSSFGDGIQGPFKPEQVGALPPLAQGEYYDEFIHGEIGKIWYWNDKVVALESKPMVSVTGDGASTLRQLVTAIKSRAISLDWSVMATIASYQGLTIEDVVPEGQSVLVDFRYLSALHPYDVSNHNVLEKFKGTRALEQLEQAGPVFWKGIPEDIRQNTLYTIDAIFDTDGNVAFLEMNSNPVVHPDTYVAMLEGLFGVAPINLIVSEHQPRPFPSHLMPAGDGAPDPIPAPAALPVFPS